MPSLKYLLVPVLLLPLLAAVDASPIIKNPNFDFLPAEHASKGPDHVNINKTNCPAWAPTDNLGNIPYTSVATESTNGFFDLPDCKTALQIQTDRGIQDVYQEITITTSGTYALSMDVSLRTDNINTDGNVFLELWRGSVKSFRAGRPLNPDSSVSPHLDVKQQTFSRTYKFLRARQIHRPSGRRRFQKR